MIGLPEIELIRRSISHKIIHQRIIAFNLFHSKVLRSNKLSLSKYIIESSVKDIYCHGLLLIFKLTSGYYLFLHLKFNSKLLFNSQTEIIKKNIGAIIQFQNSLNLLFVDPRHYGYFKILNDAERKRFMVTVGTDPLSKDFTYKKFIQIVRNKRTNLKNFLTNPKYVSGLNNLYSDEICFASRLLPSRSIKTLSRAQLYRLYKSILKILKKSIEYGGMNGTHLPNFSQFVMVYNKVGERCLKCNIGLIGKKKIGRYQAYFCNICQS